MIKKLLINFGLFIDYLACRNRRLDVCWERAAVRSGYSSSCGSFVLPSKLDGISQLGLGKQISIKSDIMVQALNKLSKGEKFSVVTLVGGCQAQEQLVSRGVYAGTSGEVLEGGSSGPMLIKIGHSRLALGQGLANKVIVALK